MYCTPLSLSLSLLLSFLPSLPPSLSLSKVELFCNTQCTHTCAAVHKFIACRHCVCLLLLCYSFIKYIHAVCINTHTFVVPVLIELCMVCVCVLMTYVIIAYVCICVHVLSLSLSPSLSCYSLANNVMYTMMIVCVCVCVFVDDVSVWSPLMLPSSPPLLPSPPLSSSPLPSPLLPSLPPSSTFNISADCNSFLHSSCIVIVVSLLYRRMTTFVIFSRN